MDTKREMWRLRAGRQRLGRTTVWLAAGAVAVAGGLTGVFAATHHATGGTVGTTSTGSGSNSTGTGSSGDGANGADSGQGNGSGSNSGRDDGQSRDDGQGGSLSPPSQAPQSSTGGSGTQTRTGSS